MLSKRLTVFVATAAAALATAAAAPVGASALDIASPARNTADGCTHKGAGALGHHYDCTFFGSKFHCIQGYADAPAVVYCKRS